MNRNNNWGYLPDYSNQNHTLRFARKSRNSDSYHRPDDRIPAGAYVGGILFALGLVGLMWVGHIAGF